MSPKGFVVLLVLGLCAVQMASAHREARGITEIIDAAKSKLSSLIGNAEDAARISMETVNKYVSKVENKLLTTGTDLLAKAGYKLDLVLVSELLKDNVKTCAKDETVKADAKTVIGSVASCITKDVANLMSLINDMKSLWKTAKTLPDAIGDVSNQCKAHANDADDDDDDEPLQLLDTSHDLADVTNNLLESAQHRLSKRALWGLKRITRCITTVYSLAKNDLVSLPGDILNAATHAFQLTQAAQGGMTVCVGAKLAENANVITRLGVKLGTCVASGVSTDARLKTIVQDNPSLAGIQQLANLASFVGNSGNAMNTAKAMANLLG